VSRETRVSRPLRLRRLVIALALIVVGLGTGWYWRVHPAGRSGAAQAIPQPVGVATIDKGDVRIVLNELGTVTPLATVTVKTQINGLAQIDPRPFQVALEQAQGQLAYDQGLLQQAQTKLKRFQTLGRQDSIAQQQVDDQRCLVAQDVGTAQSDQGQVDSANLNLTYCHSAAPVAGQIGLRLVDPGNYVQTCDANGVVVITQMQPTLVIFLVPEDNLPGIIQRLRGGASPSVEAYDRANIRKLATRQPS
jgi:membrane fusion protein, multidrug efflux system